MSTAKMPWVKEQSIVTWAKSKAKGMAIEACHTTPFTEGTTLDLARRLGTAARMMRMCSEMEVIGRGAWGDDVENAVLRNHVAILRDYMSRDEDIKKTVMFAIEAGYISIDL
jgi:hypothetical protein